MMESGWTPCTCDPRGDPPHFNIDAPLSIRLAQHLGGHLGKSAHVEDDGVRDALRTHGGVPEVTMPKERGLPYIKRTC